LSEIHAKPPAGKALYRLKAHFIKLQCRCSVLVTPGVFSFFILSSILDSI
jgi:hypothetical protein